MKKPKESQIQLLWDLKHDLPNIRLDIENGQTIFSVLDQNRPPNKTLAYLMEFAADHTAVMYTLTLSDYILTVVSPAFEYVNGGKLVERDGRQKIRSPVPEFVALIETRDEQLGHRIIRSDSSEAITAMFKQYGSMFSLLLRVVERLGVTILDLERKGIFGDRYRVANITTMPTITRSELVALAGSTLAEDTTISAESVSPTASPIGSS